MRPRRARYLKALAADTPVTMLAQGVGSARPPRILVIAHVYYPELWDELGAGIERIPGDVDLVVTLVEGRADHLVEPILRRFPAADVRAVPNCGRDVWPLLQVLDQLGDHDAVLKVHTKRSPHMRRGDAWRRDLLSGLIGSTEHIERILGQFGSDPRIGMIAPARSVLGREFLGPNRGAVEALSRTGRRPFDPDALWFPSGSMFWARSEVLEPLVDLNLAAADFGVETGAVDGTLAHAVERYLGVIAATQDLAVIEIPDMDRLRAARQRR
jgi:lipopolysaccharide biosynthesis protein